LLTRTVLTHVLRLCVSDCYSRKLPAPTEIYPLSLHDALPISSARSPRRCDSPARSRRCAGGRSAASTPSRCSATSAARPPAQRRDRKSTRLNSSHGSISYAVFCLKKKKILLVYELIRSKLIEE